MNKDIEIFVRMARPEYSGSDDDLRAEAMRIEARYGAPMLTSVVGWLYDTDKRENPINTRNRWAGWLAGANDAKGVVL